MSVNLKKFTNEIARDEGKKKNIGVAQTSEIVGCIGRRWRNMSLWPAFLEFRAIRNRAGKNKGEI